MTEKDALDPQRFAVARDIEDDWALYAKFEKGDLPAFHQLFNRYKNKILNISHRFVQNKETAEDIAQEVLIKIYEKKVGFRANTKFSTWVYRVTVNASLDILRKRKFFGFSLNKPKAGSEDDSLSMSELVGDDKSPSVSESLGNKEMEAAVTEGIRNLPEKLRVVITLFGFEEKSYQEISEILGISAKAVERRIYRAKEILRDKLSKNVL